MPTIIQYSRTQPPVNAYPHQIVSPPDPSACCFSAMEDIGEEQSDARWVFQYRRCQTCGYAVRFVLREIPNATLAGQLRQIFTTAFSRNANH
jgi:hypothetical protein